MKYSGPNRPSSKKNAQEPHVIWRGIGFAMMVIIPFVSYFGMDETMKYNQANHLFPIPQDLVLTGTRYPLLLVNIVVFILWMLALFAIFMVITFIINRIIAPPRYGPYDAPPVKYRPRKK